MNLLTFNLRSKSVGLLIITTMLFSVSCSTDGTEELEELDNVTTKMQDEDVSAAKAPESIYSDVQYFVLETSAHQSGTSTNEFDSDDEISGVYQGINRHGGYLYLNNQSGSNERTELKEISDRSLNSGVHGLRFTGQPKNIPNGTGVTIGQIHHRSFSNSRPLVRVYCTTSKVEVKKAKTHVKSDSTMELLGSIGFSDGNKLDVRLHMNGNNSIHVYVKNLNTGSYIHANEVIGDSDDSAWDDVDDYYFKCGVYNQGTNKAAHINIWDFDLY